jgi:hypothetical protein
MYGPNPHVHGLIGYKGDQKFYTPMLLPGFCKRMKKIEQMSDRESKYGKAWRINLQKARAHLGVQKGDDGAVCSWVVEAPWAHPFWCNYWICCINLRPCTRLKVPLIKLQGATHEVFVFALDPEVVPDLLKPGNTRLSPMNFAGQWVAGSDLDAEEKIEQTVDLILAGKLSPDTDFLQQWVGLFSGSNLKEWRGFDLPGR